MKPIPSILSVPLLPLYLCGSIFILATFASANTPGKTAPIITRTPSGQTIVTSRFGNGTRTTDTSGKSWTSTRFGNGTITKGSNGSNYTTSRYGNSQITKGTGTPPPVIPSLPKK